MKKNVIFIFPLLFLLLSFFNLPSLLPANILQNHYFTVYLSYLNSDYYFSILKKYGRITIFNGNSKINLNENHFNSEEKLDQFLKNFEIENKINFYDFVKFCLNYTRWYEKTKIILPFYPFAQEYEFVNLLQKERGIPIEIIVEKELKKDPIVSISTKHFLNEKKIRVNILLSDYINDFKQINIYKFQDNKKILLESKSINDIIKNANILEFYYSYSNEKKIDFILDLNGEKEEISLFSIALTEELDKNILFISEDKSKGYFDQLLNAEKIDLSELKSKNLNQYSLLIFDGIPLKKLDEDISKKIVDGYNEDNFGLFFISEAKEIGKVDDNPIIESILPIELNPKSLKQDPKVAILLLLDVSSSMMGEKLSIAKVSASQMLVNLKPEDLVSIYLFWDQFEKLFNFMPVKEVSTFFSFDKIEATGGTDLAPCLEKGLKDLLRVSSVNRHVVIISDFQTKPASWDNILSYAVENDITISVIQIGTDINSSLAEKIAKVTGGNIYSANSFNAIPTILFEDRKRIARPPFLKQNYTIFDSYKDAIAQISGMNITTSKEKSNVILKNQYDDPLFAFIKKGSKGVAVFLSDSKGIYTKNLFNKNYVKLIFNKYIESQISNLINKVSVIETASGFSVLINSPDLYQPEGILFFNQEKVYQYSLNKLTSGYFSFSISTIDSGLYTLQIKDMGNTMLKIPVYFNGKSVSNNYSSIIYAYNNKKMTFRKYYSANLWLILFFLSSILTTYFLRIFKK